MGETCDICGREIAKKATDPSSWCWRQLLQSDHDVSADYECYKFGFDHLQSLYREWQDEIDKHREQALSLKADLFAARQAVLTEGLARNTAESALAEARGREKALREALETLRDGYDHVAHCLECGETSVARCAELEGENSGAAKAVIARMDADAALALPYSTEGRPMKELQGAAAHGLKSEEGK